MESRQRMSGTRQHMMPLPLVAGNGACRKMEETLNEPPDRVVAALLYVTYRSSTARFWYNEGPVAFRDVTTSFYEHYVELSAEGSSPIAFAQAAPSSRPYYDYYCGQNSGFRFGIGTV